MLVKKINLKCLLMLTILFLSSCENKNIINSTTPNSVRNVFSTIIDNPQDVKCLFRVSSGINWTLKDGENVATPIKTNYCYAYISDGTNFISPNTIKCNAHVMQNMATDGTNGQFQYTLLNRHLENIEWEMSDYLGLNYSKLDNNLPEIKLTNINYSDVLHKSTGINLNYSGSTNNGIISIYLYVDVNEGINGVKRYIVEKQVSDNGNVSFTSSELSTLPITYNTINSLSIEMFRNKIVVEEFSGNKFVKLYETRFYTECILAE